MTLHKVTVGRYCATVTVSDRQPGQHDSTEETSQPQRCNNLMQYAAFSVSLFYKPVEGVQVLNAVPTFWMYLSLHVPVSVYVWVWEGVHRGETDRGVITL